MMLRQLLRYLVLFWLLTFSTAYAQEVRQRYFHYNQLFTATDFSLTSDSLDGADDGKLVFSGGGAIGTTRGGRITLYGSDRGGAGLGGGIYLESGDSGDVALTANVTGDVILETTGNGYIDFKANNDQKWFIPPSAGNLSEFIFDIDPIDTQWTAYIMGYNHGDGHDTGRLSLTGGGDIGGNRGGRIDLYGSDRGGAGLGGDVLITAADNGNVELSVAGTGDVVLETEGTGYIDFKTNNEQKWFIPPSAADHSELIFDIQPVDAQWTAYIMGYDHGDGHDSGRLSLTGGGNIGGNRGGRIDLYGSDRGGAGAGGDVHITAADSGNVGLYAANTGDIILDSDGVSSYIEFHTNTQRKWFIPPSVAGESLFIFDIQPVDTQWSAYIMGYDHGDGHDTGRLTLNSGGNIGATRGARLDLYGSDHGGAGAGGDAFLLASDNGDVALRTLGSGDVVLDAGGATGYIDFETNGAQRWFIPPSAALLSHLLFGADASPEWIGLISSANLDGNDKARVILSAGGTEGGSIGYVRGGTIDMFGNEFVTAAYRGDVNITAGETGEINMAAGSLTRWVVETDGDFANVASSGNVVFVAGTGVRTGGGSVWSDFGAVTASGCSVSSGRYADLKIGGASVKVAICN